MGAWNQVEEERGSSSGVSGVGVVVPKRIKSPLLLFSCGVTMASQLVSQPTRSLGTRSLLFVGRSRGRARVDALAKSNAS